MSGAYRAHMYADVVRFAALGDCRAAAGSLFSIRAQNLFFRV